MCIALPRDNENSTGYTVKGSTRMVITYMSVSIGHVDRVCVLHYLAITRTLRDIL